MYISIFPWVQVGKKRRCKGNMMSFCVTISLALSYLASESLMKRDSSLQHTSLSARHTAVILLHTILQL